MGKKKMALDKVVVQDLDRDDPEDEDVESILKYGAAELFKDDDADHEIRYDDASIDKLLDRSQIESTKTGDDDSAESQFGFARIWVSDKDALQDDFDTVDDEIAPDPGVWDKILKERQAAAAADALAQAEAMGRGRRAKAVRKVLLAMGRVTNTSRLFIMLPRRIWIRYLSLAITTISGILSHCHLRRPERQTGSARIGQAPKAIPTSRPIPKMRVSLSNISTTLMQAKSSPTSVVIV